MGNQGKNILMYLLATASVVPLLCCLTLLIPFEGDALPCYETTLNNVAARIWYECQHVLDEILVHDGCWRFLVRLQQHPLLISWRLSIRDNTCHGTTSAALGASLRDRPFPPAPRTIICLFSGAVAPPTVNVCISSASRTCPVIVSASIAFSTISLRRACAVATLTRHSPKSPLSTWTSIISLGPVEWHRLTPMFQEFRSKRGTWQGSGIFKVLDAAKESN